MAGALRRIPTVLHEHANLTATPWFQRIADRALEPFTDIALAVSQSTADFVIDAAGRRLEGQGRIPGRPARRVQPAADGWWRSPTRAASSGSRLGVRHRHDHPPARFEGQFVLVDAAVDVVRQRPAARFFLVGEGPLLGALQDQAVRLGLGDRFVFAGFRRDVARTLGLRPQRLSIAVEGTPITPSRRSRWAKPIVATDADGLLDILTPITMLDRPEARRSGARRPHHLGDRPSRRTRAAGSGRPRDRPPLRHRRLRPQDGAPVQLLHQVSRASHRRGVLAADLAFLTGQ